ncbi:MAG TPA: insulinase family protein, partial [Streptomyces sp.]
GLRLPLPPGTRRPVPRRPAILAPGPAYFSHGSGGVAFSTVVRHGAEAQVFAKVLERELFRALRQEGGYSYEVTTSYQVRGDGFAEIRGLADALPDKQAAVLGGVVDVLAQFRAGRIDPRDVETVRTQAESALYGVDADAARLPEHAVALLAGLPLPGAEDRIAELRAIDVANVHAVAVEACGSMLLRAPHGRSADWAGYSAVPRFSAAAIAGTRFPAHGQADTELVVGADGCSLQTPEGVSTVRFADCAAMLAWPDGGRRLIGADGATVQVDPPLFTGVTPAVTAAIDAAVGPHRTLPQASRAIPAPPPAPSALPHKRASRVLFTVAALFGVIALLATAGMAMDPPDTGGWIGAGFLWLLAGLFAFTAVRRRRM